MGVVICSVLMMMIIIKSDQNSWIMVIRSVKKHSENFGCSHVSLRKIVKMMKRAVHEEGFEPKKVRKSIEPMQNVRCWYHKLWSPQHPMKLVRVTSANFVILVYYSPFLWISQLKFESEKQNQKWKERFPVDPISENIVYVRALSERLIVRKKKKKSLSKSDTFFVPLGIRKKKKINKYKSTTLQLDPCPRSPLDVPLDPPNSAHLEYHHMLRGFRGGGGGWVEDAGGLPRRAKSMRPLAARDGRRRKNPRIAVVRRRPHKARNQATVVTNSAPAPGSPEKRGRLEGRRRGGAVVAAWRRGNASERGGVAASVWRGGAVAE